MDPMGIYSQGLKMIVGFIFCLVMFKGGADIRATVGLPVLVVQISKWNRQTPGLMASFLNL